MSAFNADLSGETASITLQRGSPSETPRLVTYEVPYREGMSVLDAITKAGGLTDLAKGQAVTVTRTMPDGTKEVSTVDVKNALLGRKSTSDIKSSMLLLPDDIVYVPMSIF